MPIVGFNHRLSLLHMSKRMVYIYTIGKTIHKFSIGYIINPSLQLKTIFKTQVEKFLGYSFSIRKMKTIKMFLTKKYTSVMALIIIYENNGEIPKTVYRVLSCVVYTLIDNYFFLVICCVNQKLYATSQEIQH